MSDLNWVTSVLIALMPPFGGYFAGVTVAREKLFRGWLEDLAESGWGSVEAASADQSGRDVALMVFPLGPDEPLPPSSWRRSRMMFIPGKGSESLTERLRLDRETLEPLRIDPALFVAAVDSVGLEIDAETIERWKKQLRQLRLTRFAFRLFSCESCFGTWAHVVLYAATVPFLVDRFGWVLVVPVLVVGMAVRKMITTRF